MTLTQSNKKYPQPYSSRHVISNTSDSVRADEPVYIRKFPRFLTALYNKQTPYNQNIVPSIRVAPSPEDEYTSSKKSLTSKSPIRASSAQQRSFKTLGQTSVSGKTSQNNMITIKSPTQISAIPSDFEHIFHYSETQ